MTTTSVTLSITFATIDDMHVFLNKTGKNSDLPIQRIEAVTSVTSMTSAPAAALTPFDKLMIELNTEQWTLRSEVELRELTGVNDPRALLDRHGVSYVTRTRRRDRATLIGLASRN